MQKKRIGYETGYCTNCGFDVTFEHEIKPSINDAGEEFGTTQGDVIDYGECVVAKIAENPNYLNDVEKLSCPFYKENYMG